MNVYKPEIGENLTVYSKVNPLWERFYPVISEFIGEADSNMIAYCGAGQNAGNRITPLGARKMDISNIYNVETMLLGLASGLIGVILSLILQFPGNFIQSDVRHIGAFADSLVTSACAHSRCNNNHGSERIDTRFARREKRSRHRASNGITERLRFESVASRSVKRRLTAYRGRLFNTFFDRRADQSTHSNSRSPITTVSPSLMPFFLSASITPLSLSTFWKNAKESSAEIVTF